MEKSDFHSRLARASRLTPFFAPTSRMRHSVSGRLTLAVAALFALGGILITVASARHTAQEIRASAIERARLLGTSLGRHALAPGETPASVAHALSALMAHEPLLRVRYRNPAGDLLVDSVPRDAGIGHWSIVTGDWATGSLLLMPVLLADNRGGVLDIRVASDVLVDRVAGATAATAVAAGLMAILGTLAFGWLSRRETHGLAALARAARALSRGEARSGGAPPQNSGAPEIRALGASLNASSAAVQHYVERLEEARELLAHREARLGRLVSGMHEALFEADLEGRFTFLSPAWERLTGHPVTTSLGHRLGDFLLGASGDATLSGSPKENGDTDPQPLSVRTRDGRRLWMHLEHEALRGDQGTPIGTIGTLADVTSRVELSRLVDRYQDELYHHAVTDPLTGLYNRRHFDRQLEHLLADHHARGRPLCLLLMDLDGFKFVNDTYGHPFGDKVLRETARLLLTLVRRNDYLARLAGDEFALVLKNTSLEDATRIARKVHARITATQIALPVGHMYLQASIGVAEAPTHGTNPEQLVSAADVALYRGKHAGRNRVEALPPDQSRAMMSVFSQGFEIRRALEDGRIYPAFQPIWSLAEGRPLAWEVLARMEVNGHVVRANDFIQVAEELGLTRHIDLHMAAQALKLSPTDCALFINVDLRSFMERDFVDEMRRLLAPAREAGRRVTIEITERETAPVSDELYENIQELRNIGCALALDDFGSGYSTYHFLDRFQPDFIKIEGAFVQGMAAHESNRKIVRHIHDLARSLGIETIAENVEDEATESALRRIGITNAQGYLYGTPQAWGPLQRETARQAE